MQQPITNIKSDITHYKILELTLRMLLYNNMENFLQLPDSFKDITNHDRKLQILMVESFKIANNLSPSIMGKFRPVSSMLTFPLRYNSPPLSMRITSWIIKKESAYAEKVVRKNVELQATFFVRLVRSLLKVGFQHADFPASV